jgi:hypothetical protein
VYGSAVVGGGTGFGLYLDVGWEVGVSGTGEGLARTSGPVARTITRPWR